MATKLNIKGQDTWIDTVGFTGTQEGLTSKQFSVLDAIMRYTFTNIHAVSHGDCVGGDERFDHICAVLSKKIIVYPPEDSKKRAFTHLSGVAANRIVMPEDCYLNRNKSIVNVSHYMIVCPNEDTVQLRSGTWSTFRFALKQGKPTLVILPGGDCRHF